MINFNSNDDGPNYLRDMNTFCVIERWKVSGKWVFHSVMFWDMLHDDAISKRDTLNRWRVNLGWLNSVSYSVEEQQNNFF